MKRSADSDESASEASESLSGEESSDAGDDGDPIYHRSNPEPMSAEKEREKREFRKKLNRDAREAVSGSVHGKIKLVVHRPEADEEARREYHRLSRELLPVVREMAAKTLPLLEHEDSVVFARNQFYGSRFQADGIAYRDYRYFSKKLPPTESPSLAVGLRIDESASMAAFGRLDAAKRTAIAVYEFCRKCGIPVIIYGDTADVSKLERMSVYAYADLGKTDDDDRFRLAGIRARSNNRDGMALRIMANRLESAPQKTKLLISMSDGQPKAMDDYTGEYAIQDMQRTIAEYERKGIAFLAAAIGQDKEVIQRIYGIERYLDMTDLARMPAMLVRAIARHL